MHMNSYMHKYYYYDPSKIWNGSNGLRFEENYLVCLLTNKIWIQFSGQFEQGLE